MDLVVVDTDVVSFLFKQDTRGLSYDALLAGKDMIISFMALAEMNFWAAQKQWGVVKRRNLKKHLKQFTVFHSDNELCEKWAEVVKNARRNGRPVETADAWMAATALLLNTPLVTHNKKHFIGIDGLTVISESNP